MRAAGTLHDGTADAVLLETTADASLLVVFVPIRAACWLCKCAAHTQMALLLLLVLTHLSLSHPPPPPPPLLLLPHTLCRYRYLGKVIALATHSSITAKFDAVIARLTAIMPMDKTPSFTSIRAAADAAAAQQTDGAAAAGKQLSARNSLEEQLASPGEAGQQPQHQRAHSSGGGSSSSGPAALTVAAGSLANRLKGSSSRAGADGSLSGGPSSPRHKSAAEAAAAGATVLSVVLRSTDTSKVTCISFGDTPGASAGSTCIWWAAGDSLEFYSTSTQSTTSFAPHAEKAAITAVAVDSVGNIWCANSKGAVMMRQQRNWEQVFVEHAFASCVRCLATDADSDVVWAGDEAGRLAVLRCAATPAARLCCRVAANNCIGGKMMCSR